MLRRWFALSLSVVVASFPIAVAAQDKMPTPLHVPSYNWKKRTMTQKVQMPNGEVISGVVNRYFVMEMRLVATADEVMKNFPVDRAVNGVSIWHLFTENGHYVVREEVSGIGDDGNGATYMNPFAIIKSTRQGAEKALPPGAQRIPMSPTPEDVPNLLASYVYRPSR